MIICLVLLTCNYVTCLKDVKFDEKITEGVADKWMIKIFIAAVLFSIL